MEKTPSFGKAFDFNVREAMKLNNSSYREEFIGLFEKASSKINGGIDYYFEEDFYVRNPKKKNSQGNSYNEFKEEFINSFKYGSSERVHLILGRAGIGKSSFFEKGIKKLISGESMFKGKYIKLEVDFSHIAANANVNEDFEYYANWMRKTLNDEAIKAIKRLARIKPNETYLKTFNEEREKYGTIHQNTQDSDTMLFPVMYFCNTIFRYYGKPGIIVFDNIDLACTKIQKAVFSSIGVVCNELKELFEYSDKDLYNKECYRVYFAMRPETHLLIKRDFLVGKEINFPFPNILKISMEILKNVLLDTAKEFDEKEPLKYGVTFFNVIDNEEDNEKVRVETHNDLAIYFNKILDYYLKNIWNENKIIKRLGTSEEFHCDIVDYNIRNFLTFLANTLSNGGFKPFTKSFNNKSYKPNYTVFDYIEMIISGRWEIHPGNSFINNEGRVGAPIIFNIFDDSSSKDTQDKIKHFMLNIRILQMLSFKKEDCQTTYKEFENNLKIFFDEIRIKDATKKLVYMRIINSSNNGIADVASINSWNEINIYDDTVLDLETVGRFYLEKLICEFEYLYQMALSSLMPSVFIDDVIKCYKRDKEQVVLYFLKGIFYILKDNTSFSETGKYKLSKFKEFFCQENDVCKPYRRMLESFIKTLNHKFNAAESRVTRSQQRLKIILSEAEELKKEVDDYFSLIFGDLQIE